MNIMFPDWFVYTILCNKKKFRTKLLSLDHSFLHFIDINMCNSSLSTSTKFSTTQSSNLCQETWMCIRPIYLFLENVLCRVIWFYVFLTIYWYFITFWYLPEKNMNEKPSTIVHIPQTFFTQSIWLCVIGSGNKNLFPFVRRFNEILMKARSQKSLYSIYNWSINIFHQVYITLAQKIKATLYTFTLLTCMSFLLFVQIISVFANLLSHVFIVYLE